MIRRLLARLDAHGLDRPAAIEGFPEDRCPVCGRPMIDHPAASAVALAFGTRSRAYPAKWPHRFYSLLELI
jgi:hypothetical protein